MKTIMGHRLVLVAGLLLPAAACSVTEYKVPVSAFAEATRDSEQALIGLNQQVTDAYAAIQRNRVLDGTRLVQFFETREDGGTHRDCLVVSERCRLVTVDASGNQELLSPEPPLGKMVLLMGAIRTYADGLTAIVSAETAQNVTTQVNATLGSIEDLGATVAKLKVEGTEPAPMNPVTEFKSPVANAVNWIFGQYVASVQLEGLKRATSDAKPVIAGAAEIFGDAADVSADVPRVSLAKAVAKRNDAFDDKQSEGTLDQLIESAAAYDQLLLAEPASVFTRLVEAHDVLADRLQDENLSVADAMARIRAFQREAQTLKDIVEQLAAASKIDAEG